MLRILAVILRNLKLLLRSRVSALIIILGPLFIIFLVGLAFNTSSLYAISIGYYAPDASALTSSFIDEIQQSDFNVKQYYSPEGCMESIRWSETHVCMIFPQNFAIDNDVTQEIIFYADTSKVNLVYMVLDALSSQVSSRTTQLTAGLTDVLIGALDNTRLTLKNDTETLTLQGAKRNIVLDEADEAVDTLDALNLNTPVSGFSNLEEGTADFEDTIDDIVDAADDAVSEFTSLMNKVEDNADDIVDLLDGTNLSASDAENILIFINESKVALDEIRTRLDSSSGNASSQIDDLDDLIEDVGENFNDVAFLLDKAKTGRSQAKENIDDIRSAVDQSEDLAKQVISGHDDLIASLDAIQITNSQSIARPITTVIKPVTSEQSNLSYLYPSLITLVLMFICLLLSSTLVSMEKKSSAAFRNFCTPTRDMSFTFGTYFTALLIVSIQLSIILGISAYVFNANFIPNIVSIISILFVLVSLFIFLGMSLGHFFNSEETVTLASISVGSTLLLMSDLILPIESMPAHIARFAQYNPFVMGSNLLKQVILFNFPLSVLWESLNILILFTLIIFVITFIVQKLMKERFLRLYARYNVQKQKARRLLKIAPEENIVVNGKTIKNLGELAKEIHLMSMTNFQEHVDKNIIEDWIRKAYKDNILAGMLAKKPHQGRWYRLLKKAQKARDKQMKRSRK